MRSSSTRPLPEASEGLFVFDNGFGGQIDAAWPVSDDRRVRVRADLGVLVYGHERFGYCYETAFGCRIAPMMNMEGIRRHLRLEAAVAAVGDKLYRIWRVYMAGSAQSFERGWLSVYQVLAGQPLANGARDLPATRGPTYAP